MFIFIASIRLPRRTLEIGIYGESCFQYFFSQLGNSLQTQPEQREHFPREADTKLCHSLTMAVTCSLPRMTSEPRSSRLTNFSKLMAHCVSSYHCISLWNPSRVLGLCFPDLRCTPRAVSRSPALTRGSDVAITYSQHHSTTR